MKSIRPFVVIFFMVNLYLTQPAQAAAADLPADAQVMHRQKLFDPGIGKDAFSVLVPDGWKMNGEVIWILREPAPVVQLAVYDLKQQAGWRQYPGLLYADGIMEKWVAAFPLQRLDIERRFAQGKFTDDNLEIRYLPRTPREYLEKIFAPKFCQELAEAKDVKLVSEKDLTDMEQTRTKSDPLHRTFRLSRIRYTYTTPDGPVEREFVVTLIVARMPPGPGPGISAFWTANVVTCRAPEGKLDALMPTFTAIGSSVAPLPDWFNIMDQTAVMFLQQANQAQNQILSDQRDAINARMKILHDAAAKTSADMSDRVRQRFADQQNAKDKTQRQFMHYVNDTSSYRDPNDGSTVTLKANYRYQYINNFGDVIQTNDATFKPPVDPKTTWNLMEKAD